MEDHVQRFTQSTPALVAAHTPWALSGQIHAGVPSWSPAIALCALFAFSACSATLTRRDGVALEGTISGSNAESVWIRTEHGTAENVRRTDIASIDHPGNVLGTIGLALATGSGALLGVTLSANHPDGRTYATAIGQWGTCLVTGVVLAIIGWSDYFASRSAANNLASTPPAPVRLSPAAEPTLPPPVAPAASSPPNSPDR
jgi:hypothetical protein